jgi:hypothetical protein
MSTPVRPNQTTTTPAPKPFVPYVKAPEKKSAPESSQAFLFDKENYMWMIAGVALIFIGFMLMSGGKSANPHEFHYEEIYSFRRITLAPIVVLLGFVVEVFAIMKRPNDAADQAV